MLSGITGDCFARTVSSTFSRVNAVKKARKQLRHALRNQKTISINKLKRILNSMNVSLKESPDTIEIKYLKNEIKKLVKENRRLKGELTIAKSKQAHEGTKETR